jgi:hypothetical protein
MTGARRRALLFLLLAVIAAAALGLAAIRRAAPLPARPSERRPPLLLLTSLPLVFGEDFSLHGGSTALKKLQTRYRVIPISAAAPSDLSKGRLLLMAQPPAQTAENLVTLDDWVRRGGRVLLLADPLLEWPSQRPLGDPLRPPPMFTDTGLLAHWGLTLDAPVQPAAASRRVGSFEVQTFSPGTLRGKCAVGSDGFVARCPIGRGTATIVADADLLNVDQLGPKAHHNLDALLEELATLEHK